MKYSNHLNYRDRKRLLFKLRIIFIILAFLILGVFVFLYKDYLRDKKINTDASSTSEKSTSFIAPTINIFKTPQFQFQAPNSWVELSNESNASKFVYRSLRTNLIEHELIVYVNQVPANLESNRVLPVSLKNEGAELDVDTVSDHCSKVLGGQTSSAGIDTTILNIKMRCDADSTNYTVIAGLKAGSTILNMRRPDGSNGAYTLYYTNLRAVQDSTEFSQILKTFQTR